MQIGGADLRGRRSATRTITVDGEPVDLAMEYTPGDQLVEAEVDGEDIGVAHRADRAPG